MREFLRGYIYSRVWCRSGNRNLYNMQPLTFVLSLLVLGAHMILVLGVDCEVDGQRYKAGEVFQRKGICARYTCEAKGVFSGVTCPWVASNNPDCRTTAEDRSKPFPNCCRSIVC